MNRVLLKFIIISLAIHLSILLFLLVSINKRDDFAKGLDDVSIAVGIVTNDYYQKKDRMTKTTEGNNKSPLKKIRTNNYSKDYSEERKGVPGSNGSNMILSEIKRKIDKAKKYPLIARRKKIEGRTIVLFEINTDGSLKYVKISGTSGEKFLDSAAIEAVKSAAPLPFYEQPIKLAIRYNIR